MRRVAGAGRLSGTSGSARDLTTCAQIAQTGAWVERGYAQFRAGCYQAVVRLAAVIACQSCDATTTPWTGGAQVQGARYAGAVLS